MGKIVNVVSVFLLLVIIFIPFPASHLSFNTVFTQFVYQDLVIAFANVLNIEIISLNFDSDSVSLIILLLFLFCISLSALFFKQANDKICAFAKVISCYYLIFVLLSYGLNKVFLEQFPMPEANILYSDFGVLQKDILYWSVLGLAPVYTFLIGFAECSIAFLLFFRKTRLFGLFLSVLSFSYIFIINISFDISVKIFSFLLMLITMYQLYFYRARIKKLTVFIFSKTVKQPSSLMLAVKTFVLFLFISILTVPYLLENQSDKDLSGAYYLEDSSCVNNSKAFNIKRLFILKQGYVVFENTNEEMIDYKIIRFDNFLSLEKQQNITTFVIKNKDKNSLILQHAGCTYVFKILPVDELPVFTHKNHLFIDYVH